MLDSSKGKAAGESASAAPRAIPSLLLPAVLTSIAFHLVFIKLVGHFMPRADFGAIVGSAYLLFAVGYPSFALLGAGAALALGSRAEGELPLSPLAAFDRLAMRTVLCALVLAFIASVLPLDRVFKFPANSYAAVIPLLASAVVLEAAAVGTLLGAGCERSFASALIASPSLRIALAFTAFSLGVGSFAPLIAILLGSTLTAAIARARLARSIAVHAPLPTPSTGRRDRPESPFATLRSIPAIFSLLAFGLFVHADVLLVRIRLSPDEAAGYAALAIIGRVGLLLTLPISFSLYIRVRRAIAERRGTGGSLVRALVATGVLHGVILAIAWLRPELPFTLLVDSTIYHDVVGELPRYALASAVYSLAQIVLFYGLAFERVWLYLLPLGYLPLAINLVLRNGDRLDNCVTATQAQAILFGTSLALMIGAFTLILPWWLKRIGLAPEQKRD